MYDCLSKPVSYPLGTSPAADSRTETHGNMDRVAILRPMEWHLPSKVTVANRISMPTIETHLDMALKRIGAQPAVQDLRWWWRLLSKTSIATGKHGFSMTAETQTHDSTMENQKKTLKWTSVGGRRLGGWKRWLAGIAVLSAMGLHFEACAATLPEVKVSAKEERGDSSPLAEERLVGDNNQPEGTTERRFATTRTYVIAPWQIEFEQWWKGKFRRNGETSHLFQSELEIGLPYRFQFDFYENILRNETGNLRHDGNQVELRWALAEWGKIPLNPTLYGEWKFNHNAPDAYEIKLLLAEELAPRWHWGFNAFYEQEAGGGRESELGARMAV